MILVDSSVWIDYFNGHDSPQTAYLDRLLGSELVALGDLILLEVLQGFAAERDFQQVRGLLESLTVFSLLDPELAIRGACHHRRLHRQGVTVRKTIDTIIATFCIERGHRLLFSDRDFLPFVHHLGLRQVEAS